VLGQIRIRYLNSSSGHSSSDKQTTSGDVAGCAELAGVLLPLNLDRFKFINVGKSGICGRTFGRFIPGWLLASAQEFTEDKLGVDSPPVLTSQCPLWGTDWKFAGIDQGVRWENGGEVTGILPGAGWLGLPCGTVQGLEAGMDVGGL